VMVSTFNCGLFVLRDLDGSQPTAQWVYSFSKSDKCALPVVAVAAAIVVVVGLVLVVRTLLHNDDKRTTVFAVLVGLLLTASPAVLVLLGR